MRFGVFKRRGGESHEVLFSGGRGCFSVLFLLFSWVWGKLHMVWSPQERHTGGPGYLGGAVRSMESQGCHTGPCSSGDLDGDAVLDERRVQVGVGQGQLLGPFLDILQDLGQAALEGGDAPPGGLLDEVLLRVGAQGPLGGNGKVRYRGCLAAVTRLGLPPWGPGRSLPRSLTSAPPSKQLRTAAGSSWGPG